MIEGCDNNLIAFSLSMTMLSVNASAPLVNFDQDILTELLRDKRSPNTRRTYSKGLKDFFVTMTQFEPSPDAVAWFLSLGRFQAIALVLRYLTFPVKCGLQAASLGKGHATSTNRAKELGYREEFYDDVRDNPPKKQQTRQPKQ